MTPCAVFTPVIRPSLCIKDTTGHCNKILTPRASSAASNCATSALPFTRCIPRPWMTTSSQCRTTRLVTCQKALGFRKASKKFFKSRPDAMPMPKGDISGNGSRTSFNRAPNRRPSNGAAQSDRPPNPAPGVLSWKSGILFPSTKVIFASSRKKAIMRGPCSRKRCAMASSNCGPNSWRK